MGIASDFVLIVVAGLVGGMLAAHPMLFSLRREQPAFGFGNGTSKILSGFEPFRDHRFSVRKSLLPRRTVSGAAR